MKRFHFQLERVLGLRKHREREWELKLAAATAEVMQMQRDLDANALEYATSVTAGYASMSVSELMNRELYHRRLLSQSQSLQVVLQQKEQARQQVRGGYLEAQKARKVMDKLRERRQQSYYENQRRVETESLTDQVLMRHGRADSGNGDR